MSEMSLTGMDPTCDADGKGHRPSLKSAKQALWRLFFFALLVSLLLVVLGVIDPPWWRRAMESFYAGLDRAAVAVESMLRRLCGVPVGFPS